MQLSPTLPIFSARASRWIAQTLFNKTQAADYFDPLLESIDPQLARGRFSAKVMEVRRETADTCTFILKPSPRWSGFYAGQHVTLDIEQYGARHSRTFSLASSPSLWHKNGLIRLTIKQVTDGKITPWMHQHLRSGAIVGLSQAFGEFSLPAANESALYIAGGSGITPILSHLEALAEHQHAQPVTLIYCVRSSADSIAWRELEALAARWPQLSLHRLFSQPDNGGTAELLAVHHLTSLVTNLPGRRCYICGPQALMVLADSLLQAAGISENAIQRAHFGAPRRPVIEGQVSSVHLLRSQQTLSSDGNQSLLELAEAANLKPRYGCRMGICHQCSCKKTEGTVINRLTGKASGPGAETIQLCIAVPQGPVTIEL